MACAHGAWCDGSGFGPPAGGAAQSDARSVQTVEAESPVEPISEEERRLLDARIGAAQARPNDVEPWPAVRERLMRGR